MESNKKLQLKIKDDLDKEAQEVFDKYNITKDELLDTILRLNKRIDERLEDEKLKLEKSDSVLYFMDYVGCHFIKVVELNCSS